MCQCECVAGVFFVIEINFQTIHAMNFHLGTSDFIYYLESNQRVTVNCEGE